VGLSLHVANALGGLAVEGRGGMWWVASPPVSDMAPSLNAPVVLATSLNAAVEVLGGKSTAKYECLFHVISI
jgi:hypothetical protein